MTKIKSETHVPIMVNEILRAFAESPVCSFIEKSDSQKSDDHKKSGVGSARGRDRLTYLDVTFGRGGHVAAMFERFHGISITGVDQDPSAIEFGSKRFEKEIGEGRLRLVQANFSEFVKKYTDATKVTNDFEGADLTGDSGSDEKFDFILADLGVSSPQLDQADRGFSFYHDGPLDMRMNQNSGVTAADVVNTYEDDELIDVFREYGEIRSPFRVVRAIVNDRKEKPYSSTKELAGLIERVEGWSKKGHHPATKYFMALRLEVNKELEVIDSSLPKMISMLNNHGRICVLTFHSLEDRIVKNIFRGSKNVGFPVNKKVIVASEEEQKENSRSRSAKLRIFQREFYES